MIRTRDFALFLLAVFFLVSGISATVVRDLTQGSVQAAVAAAALAGEAPPPTEPAAELPPPTLDRLSLLEHLRAAVASVLGETPTEEVVEEPAADVASSTPEVRLAALYCTSYRAVAWPHLPGAQIKEVEGARIVYREHAALPPSVDASSSTALPPYSSEEVLLQLPLQTSPLPTPSCIPYDVVGIAKDGSLIRNDEVAFYTVFDGDTLVGYALDGFPIYGVDENVAVDSCGGRFSGGRYHYQLSRERDTIISCFSGSPVSF